MPGLIGLVLPPFLGLRVLILALIGAGLLQVYEREFYDPGISHTFGVMIVAAFVVAFGAGLLVRAALLAARPILAPPPPGWVRGIDRLLLIAASGIPAGLIALMLGAGLAGAAHPMGVHLAILAALALAGGAALWGLTGHPRAATLAFCAILGGIVAHSMRMEPALRTQLAAIYPGVPKCLSIGPDALSLDRTAPLMGLTAPKPILLLVNAPDRAQVLRWSFRGGIFVEGGAPPREVTCKPALP